MNLFKKKIGGEKLLTQPIYRRPRVLYCIINFFLYLLYFNFSVTVLTAFDYLRPFSIGFVSHLTSRLLNVAIVIFAGETI